MPEWNPLFISPVRPPSTDTVVRLRRSFVLDEGHGAVHSASLRATALGVLEVEMNGVLAAEEVLAPGWSSYEWRLRFAEYDVTGSVNTHNDIEVRLGAGWYAGRLGWGGWRDLYGDRTAAALELVIEFSDGHTQTVRTDEDWRWAPSPTTSADLYDGQIIDARIGEPEKWRAVERVDAPRARLERSLTPPIVRQERIAPVRVWRTASGKLLADFGQNLVGWTRLAVQGQEGAEIVVRHAEVLEDGELGTRPLRSARATDRFILSGNDDVFEPTFTFHGFRYIEVEGWTGADEDLGKSIQAVVIGSDVRPTGVFRSSNELLNRFHDNVVWGMRGNFVGLPTDCPQRDERLGWTGDIAVFAPTAAFLFDVQELLTDWMRDVHEEAAHAEGIVPFVVPDALKLMPEEGTEGELKSPTPTAVWGDAAVWVPWALYRHDGDVERLASLYPTMALHGAAIEQVLSPTGLWDEGFQFGDWLDPLAPPDDPAAAKTPTRVVATASGYRTFTMLTRAAEVLGRDDDARHYAEVAQRMRAGFRTHFLADGRLSPETVTGYTLAIAFGLVEGAERESAGARLAQLVRQNGHRIATGFAGTPYVTDALTLTGHVDDAYRLLLQTECPSWLYPVTMGATTVWERWDSMLPDGSINPGEMTSFNHYALGSVADWMHRTVGGIAPAEPGYREVLVAPRPGGDLDWCEIELESRQGRIAVRWERRGDTLAVSMDLPVPAVLRLPGESDERVGPGRHEREVAWPSEKEVG